MPLTVTAAGRPGQTSVSTHLPASAAQLRSALKDQIVLYDDKVKRLLHGTQPVVRDTGDSDGGKLELDYKLKSPADAQYVLKALRRDMNAIDENAAESVDIVDFRGLAFQAKGDHVIVSASWTKTADLHPSAQAKKVIDALKAGTKNLPVSAATKQALTADPYFQTLSHAKKGNVDVLITAPKTAAQAKAVAAELTKHRADLAKLFSSLHGVKVSQIAAKEENGFVTLRLGWTSP